jgi:hypothetical protein
MKDLGPQSSASIRSTMAHLKAFSRSLHQRSSGRMTLTRRVTVMSDCRFVCGRRLLESHLPRRGRAGDFDLGDLKSARIGRTF